MTRRRSKRIDTRPLNCETVEDLTNRILHAATRCPPRIDFLREISRMLIEFSGCEVVEMWVKENDIHSRCEARHSPRRAFRFEMTSYTQNGAGSQDHSNLERLCRNVVQGHFDPSLPFFTKTGSFWTGDTGNPLSFTLETKGQTPVQRLCIGGNYPSLALIRITFGSDNVGLLQLKSEQRDYFSEDETGSYERIAQTLGIALAHQKAQAALLERVKELTCLYGIAQLAARPDTLLEETLQKIVELLPPAWQYPDIACASIALNGRKHSTPGFQKCRQKQKADIIVRGEPRGVIQVAYTQKIPDLDEGPFLKEERSLIDAVAKQVALIIEQRQAEEDKSRLHDQLRHADRLATIGQLAAGVAHELNEPLSSILGFAQLVKKSSGLPEQAEQDIGKIVTSSLHVREIIKKLMLFARQTPPKKIQVKLNQVVEEGIYFLEARCVKAGIEVLRFLSPDLPEINADPAQINQVLVNLVVNSMQAMPEGGKLTVRTFGSKDHVALIVEDTGIGMSEDVKRQIFIPFFTTKDIDQGTGLGLAVVHGIVTSHKGSVKVESTVGCGTRFEIQLPIAAAKSMEETDKNGQKGTHPHCR